MGGFSFAGVESLGTKESVVAHSGGGYSRQEHQCQTTCGSPPCARMDFSARTAGLMAAAMAAFALDDGAVEQHEYTRDGLRAFWGLRDRSRVSGRAKSPD